VPGELHALLQHAGEPAPYVIGGQGLGAAFATMYAAQYRAEVAALVLVDPPATDRPARRSVTRLLNAAPWLARAGVLRAGRVMSSNAAGLPEVSSRPLRAFLNRPDHLTRAALELDGWHQTVTLAAAAPLDPAMPVVRVEGAGPSHTALLTDSQRGAAVAAASKSVVQQVRVLPSCG
jgi:pimeloyl-ACP methyl ester carboxylesterase